MAIQSVPANAKRAEIHAVVIRADGTREDRGMVAIFDTNPLKHWWGNLQVRRRATRWRQKGAGKE